MLEIPLLGRFLSLASSRRLDDAVDRLHCVCTVSVLVLCAIFIGSKQHFGSPIQCMIPTHIDKGSWAAYGQYLCYVESTYRLSYNKTVPSAEIRAHLRRQRGVNVNYYQWVPYFFVIQAVCFYAPNAIWCFLQGYSYIDMKTVLAEAVSMRASTKKKDREKKLDRLIGFISASNDFRNTLQHTKNRFLNCIPANYSGYSTAIYILSKVAMLVNDFVQLKFIGHFLGIEDAAWAFHPFKLAKTISTNGYEFSSHYFPRVTFCDMERYTLANIETNTLQCIVMLNVINEKVFLMLWYWILILFITSIVNLLYTLFHIIQAKTRLTVVLSYLQVDKRNDESFLLSSDSAQLRKFTDTFLGFDGILLLSFIHSHAGAIIARDVAVRLFDFFATKNGEFGGKSSPYFVPAGPDDRTAHDSMASAPQLDDTLSRTVISKGAAARSDM